MAQAFVTLCRRDWHSALKGGVVVAPLSRPRSRENPKPKTQKIDQKPKIQNQKPKGLKNAQKRF